MAIIYSYPIATPQNTDLLIISRTPTDPDEISNYSVNMSSVADYVIDRFINPDATDFKIPVFNQGGTRITGSIMSQDSSPSNGVAGTKITIAGDLTLERDQSDTTLTLISDGSNPTPGGEQHNPSIKFIQDGGSQNAAVGFNIIDDTSGGAGPGLGNRFWIVNSMASTPVGEGGITFGTAQVDGWENAIGRFIIRGDGKGLFGHPDSLYSKTLGSQFEIYDNRDENTTTDPSFSVYSVVDTAAPSGNEGAGGIKQILDVYDNGVFQQQEAMMLIPGTNSSDFAASTPLAFYTNSNMDTASPSGFAGIIFDSGNWLLDGSGTFTTTDPGYQLKVVGNTNITGDAQIDTLTNNYIPVNNNSGVLRDSGFYQVPSSVSFTGNAIGLNTTLLDSFYGEYPDLRVASRSLNDPGVLDLFRPDGDVQPGDRVGILQYSLNDDTQYAVAQIEVKTIGQAGTGNTGGGKLCIKTSSNQAGAQVTERLCIDNTEADFSVPINVTDLNRSSFAGQVTIPATPVAATDAASKAYVDLQNTGQVSGTGTTNTLPVWSDGPNSVLSDSPISQVLDAGNNVKQIDIITTSGQSAKYSFNGAATKFGMYNTVGNDLFLLTGDNTGFYKNNFQVRGTLAVGRSSQATRATLDVGASTDTIPAAFFRNGVVISNNPSGVQVDNTSMVIGAGNNDNVSGSDHCLIVGSGNQITSNSDQSVAFGQANTITGSIDSLAVGNSNNINSAQRVYALGYQNTISSGSSFVAGGQNTVGVGDTNIVIGFSNESTGDRNFAIGNQLVSASQEMILGFRNNVSEYPATDPSNGLGEVKFVVATGGTTNVNSNALLITAGGNSGGGNPVPRVILPTVVNFNFADDTAAAAGGIPVGGLYHNAGVIRIRLT